MGYRKNTRDRLVSIMQDVAVVAGTKKTVADRVPPARQDYEGYVFSVTIGSGRTSLVAQGRYKVTLAWQLNVLSPSIGIGLRAKHEDNILLYADALHEEMTKRRLLQSTGNVGLDFVEDTRIISETTQAPLAYPDGQSEQMYYSYTMTIEVDYLWMNGC